MSTAPAQRADTVRLESVCKIVQGGRQKLSGKDFVEDGGYPGYGAGGHNGNLPSYEFDEPAIVLSAIGARCGKCFQPTGKWSSLANTSVFFPDLELADVRFLWYQLNDESSWHRSGTAQPYIKPSDIKGRKVYLPPLAEQKRIAGILDAADALRAKRRESLAQLDTLLQSTFLNMFGDPVTNPMGWERCEFGDHIEVLTDYHANGSYKVLKEHVELKNSEDFALMIRTTDLESTIFDSDNIYITREAYEFLEKSKVYGGELIINKIGSAGNVYLMPYLDRPVSLGMNAFLIRTKSSVGNLFAYYYLTSKFGDNEIKKRVKGAVTKTIRKDAVREIPFFLPSSKARESFAAIVESVKQQKASQRAHLDELDTLFASLQSRAFSGEL